MKRLPAVTLCAILVAIATNVWLAPLGEASGLAPATVPQTAVRQATPAAPEPAAPVILKWTTKSEVNTAGFNIYRAVSADGPYVMINRDLIPASNDAIAGGQYSYTDATTVAGTTYFYQLEDVEMNGTRTRHEPFRITAGASGGADIQTSAIALLAIAGVGLAGAIAWRIRTR